MIYPAQDEQDGIWALKATGLTFLGLAIAAVAVNGFIHGWWPVPSLLTVGKVAVIPTIYVLDRIIFR